MPEVLCLRKGGSVKSYWGARQGREEVIIHIPSLGNMELGTLHFMGCGLGKASFKGDRTTLEFCAELSLIRSTSVSSVERGVMSYC